MKRVLCGTFACLVILVGLVVLAARWAALFWLLILSAGVYLLFGREVEVEFRLGVEGGEERRLYGALIRKRRPGSRKTTETYRSDGLEVGSKWRDG